jgi:TolB-like protein
MVLNPGDRLGKYEILQQVGKGGMGTVYSARDTRLGREVAIKVLARDVAGDPEQMARFQREAKMLATLNNPTIATIHGLEDDYGLHYLVMELVRGPGLNDRLKSGPLPLLETLAIARQIAEALEVVHEAGMIHRDLKPSNIKLTHKGTVKLLDFGLAKTQPSLLTTKPGGAETLDPRITVTGAVLGTPAYMSPEQASGHPLDRRSDIWSFGCVLYEMLTGSAPFHGNSITECLVAIVTREPNWKTLPDSTPGRIRDLVQKCLRKDPQLRIHNIQLVRQEIEESIRDVAHEEGPGPLPDRGEKTDQILDAESAGRTTARPAARAPPAPEPKPVPGRPWFVALVVFLAAVLGGLAYLRWTQPPEPLFDSVAVLPVIPAGEDAKLARLGDSVVAEIMGRLGKVPSLRVPSREEVHQAATAIGPLPGREALGAQLGVQALLTVSLVQGKKSVTVSAELMDVQTGGILWGNKYEGVMDQRVLSQFSEDIVENVRLRLTGARPDEPAKRR